jgi:Fe-S cluster assembly ATPase SufC
MQYPIEIEGVELGDVMARAAEASGADPAEMMDPDPDRPMEWPNE